MLGQKFALVVGGSFITALVGCAPDSEVTPVEINDVTDVDFTSPVQSARDGHIGGDIGPVEGVDAPAGRLGAWDDGSYMAVEAAAQLGDRAVMIFVSASNAQDLFVPGGSGHFVFGDYNGVGAQIGVLGCVGQEIDLYDQYDAPADEVDISVEGVDDEIAGPADVSVTVTGTWYIEHPGEETELRTATSSFILER